MSDVIKLLPDSVANQIAAGEVIQRPASVIKELVENAVDAGSRSIKIILRDAGKTLIQVIDDGCGMSDTDARLAFERHATSKIRQATDLFDLRTMGFRGEALPSVAAVAQVELRTMKSGETIGTHLEISGSKFEGQQPEACAQGTNIMVKNLFFNVPARRKFLKRDSVELSHIIHEFERLALVNPSLEFLLVHNDVTLHQLLPGSLKQRIAGLFGKSLEKQLIPVETSTPLVKVSGFVSLPENARKRNPLQYFFVNGRNMRHPYFHKAVLTCYEDLISADAQPNYFLNFEVDPQTIDVNIHPTKNEIKFENEQPIWQILAAAVKESLGRFNVGPAIDFDAQDEPDIPVFKPDAAAEHGDVTDVYNPFAGSRRGKASALNGSPADTSGNWRRSASRATSDWDKLYEGLSRQSDALPAGDAYNPFAPDTVGSDGDEEGVSASVLNDFLPDEEALTSGAAAPRVLPEMEGTSTAGTIMQVRNKYIVTPSREGLLIVDRYRAHVRVLYERFASLTGGSLGETQRVIFPEVLSLTASQNAVFLSLQEEVASLGFDLSFIGDNSWSINGVPSVLAQGNPSDALLGIIENVTETGRETGEELRKAVALAMARSAAIRPGQPLAPAESERLLSDLFSLPDPRYTPDGHQVMFTLSAEEIARRL